MHGCYDTRCPGFVLVTKKIPLGLALPHISTPGGTQYYAKISLSQDVNHNWWLLYTEDLNGDYIRVGYWPKELFKHIQESAEYARMGGMVFSDKSNSPPMGSGGHDCYFQKMVVGGGIPNLDVKSESRCYKVGGGGASFWFGGPGGDFDHCRG